MADVPHFDLPFRMSGTSFAVVEQDSYGDIANSVEAIARTTVGFRDYAPEFGIPDILFNTQPIGAELIKSVITDQDPRASLMVEEKPDTFDKLIDSIVIEVLRSGGGE